MRKKLFLFLLLFFLFLPQARAQVEITGYNITYSLQKNGINITELVLFTNPEKSAQHTFMEDLVLVRQGAAKESIAVEGMQSSASKDGTIIYLYFSKDWLIKPSTRAITISYFIPSAQQPSKEGELETFEFSGRLLLSLPFTPKEANAIVKTPEGYEFGALSYPGTRTRKDAHEEILYEFRGELVKTNPFIEIEYGNFKTTGKSYAESAKAAVEESRKKAGQVNRTLILSAGYNITFPDVENKLKKALNLLNASQYYLSIYDIAEQKESYYTAFGLANLSKLSAQKALEYSAEAEALVNIRFQSELREKLSELEMLRSNLTSINLSRYQQFQLQEKEENISAEKPSQPALLAPVQTPAEEEITAKSLASYFALALLLAAAVGVFYFLFFAAARRKEGREERKSMDFSSIGELKRKKFGDFERKIARVKSESEVAEEIMKLRNEKEKYILAIQNLEKKLSAYEISEHDFVVEKENFEKKISNIEIKTKELESEIKPK